MTRRERLPIERRPGAAGLAGFLGLCASVALAAPALPQSLHLNHDNCSAAAPATNKNLNCASSSQQSVVVASVEMGPTSLNGVIADFGIVDVLAGTSPAPAMPAFWQFYSGGCSGGANFLFAADFSGGPFDCADLWGGQAGGGGQYGGAAGPTPEGNRARIKWCWAVVPDQALAMSPATEYYVCRMTLRQGKAAACGGCNTPVCWVFAEESLSLLSGSETKINRASSALTFNQPGGSPACSGSAARTRTWGQLKSLYR